MLLGYDDAFAASRVVDPHKRTARDEHGIDLFSHLYGSQPVGVGVRTAASASATSATATASTIGLFGSYMAFTVSSFWRLAGGRS